VYKKIKNSQPFRRKCQKTAGGGFFWLTLYGSYRGRAFWERFNWSRLFRGWGQIFDKIGIKTFSRLQRQY